MDESTRFLRTTAELLKVLLRERDPLWSFVPALTAVNCGSSIGSRSRFEMGDRYKIFLFILFLFYFACLLCPDRFVFASPSENQQFAADEDAQQPCDHNSHEKSPHQSCRLANEYLPSQKTTASAETAVQCGVLPSLGFVAAVVPPLRLSPQHAPNLSSQNVSPSTKLRI